MNRSEDQSDHRLRKMSCSDSNDSLQSAVSSASNEKVQIDRSASIITTSTTSSAKTGTKTKTRPAAPGRSRTVTFASTEIREYPIELGDNPSVSSGPPLTLGWTHMARHTASVDDYEAGRPHFRRALHEMIIPAKVRTDILLGSDGRVSLRAVQEAIREVNVTKRQRRRTVQTLHMARMEEMSERARRALLGRMMVHRASERRRGREILERGLECDRLIAAEAARVAIKNEFR